MPPEAVDPATKAASKAEFAARVRSGQVSPADSLPPALLSDVLEYLDVGEFSLAARTCRLWRAAAALPSAWSHSSKRGADEDGAFAEKPAGNGLWSRSVPDERNIIGPIDSTESAWLGRVLTLKFSQPEAHPALLPSLLIWRNCTAVVVTHTPELCYDREDQEHCLAAIAYLPRLETLAACFHDVAPQLVNAMLEKAGSHLRRFSSAVSQRVHTSISARWSSSRCPRSITCLASRCPLCISSVESPCSTAASRTNSQRQSSC